jgi:DnaJ-class molecular chaperone
VFFDDLTLAYTTLINEASRQEYDEYLSQNQAMAGYQRRHNDTYDEEDPDVIAEQERRQRERGKKRF